MSSSLALKSWGHLKQSLTSFPDLSINAHYALCECVPGPFFLLSVDQDCHEQDLLYIFYVSSPCAINHLTPVFYLMTPSRRILLLGSNALLLGSRPRNKFSVSYSSV